MIELIVVIAIVAILLAIMLPAILSGLESARRMRCRNNLKQIGLALHNYHAANNSFPIGARKQGTFGPSWLVPILPYIDELPMYLKFNMTAAGNGNAVTCPANGTLASGWSNSLFRCPSSTTPEWLVGTFKLMLPSYVGISGSTNAIDFLEKRVNTYLVPALSKSGVISGGGVLIANAAISISQITDGTSNTLMVGECSDWANSSSGPMDITGGASTGWFCGTSGQGTPPFFINGANNMPVYNLTTIRYPIGTRDYSLSGIYNTRSPNNPLVSAHGDVVMVLLADGSVRAAAASLDLLTLRKLATRDDGSPVSFSE